MHSLCTLFENAGMDAQVAYGFHQLRDEKPFLASGPLSNKVRNLMKYWQCSFQVPTKESSMGLHEEIQQL